MEELTHDRNDGLQRSFAGRHELFVEGTDMKFTPSGGQSKHVENAAQVGGARLGDPGKLVHGTAGIDMPDIQAAVGHPLPSGHVGGQDQRDGMS